MILDPRAKWAEQYLIDGMKIPENSGIAIRVIKKQVNLAMESTPHFLPSQTFNYFLSLIPRTDENEENIMRSKDFLQRLFPLGTVNKQVLP